MTTLRHMAAIIARDPLGFFLGTITLTLCLVLLFVFLPLIGG